MKSITELLEQYKECRTKCEIWSRVMGYMRNVKSFNEGKQSEFNNRVFYKVKTLKF